VERCIEEDQKNKNWNPNQIFQKKNHQ